MNPILRNALAVIAGALIGGILNITIINNYPALFPLPFDCPNDPETWANCFSQNAHLLEFQHLISIFLAHGLGTLIGALVASKLGVSNHLILALVIGVLFLIGGFMMCNMLNWKPLNFSILDLSLAYIPMAWLGYKIARLKN